MSLGTEVGMLTSPAGVQRLETFPAPRGMIMFGNIRPPQHVDGVQVLPKFDMRGHHDPFAYKRVPLPQETVPQLAPGGVPDRIRQGPEATWGIFGDSTEYMVYRSAGRRVPLVDYLGGLGGTSIHASFEGSSVVFERNDARVTLDLAVKSQSLCECLTGEPRGLVVGVRGRDGDVPAGFRGRALRSSREADASRCGPRWGKSRAREVGHAAMAA